MSELTNTDERDKTVQHLCKQKKFLTAAKHIENWLALEEFEIQRQVNIAINKLEKEANDVE